MKCEDCGEEYSSRYSFHGDAEESPLICIYCVDPREASRKSGGSGPIAGWMLVGAIVGGLIGCVSVQFSQQSGSFEHGAPGIAVYILFQQVGGVALGALLGAIAGAFIAHFMTPPDRNEPSEGGEETPMS
jgi:hypothetical protein